MFTKFTYENNDGAVLDLLQTYFPIKDFDVVPDIELDDSRPRPQRHGLYGTPTYRRGMDIDVEGAILADDMENYVTRRLLMVHRLFGNNFDNLVSEDQTGFVTIGFDGQDEDWTTEVAVKAFSAPKTWTEGAYSNYMITFTSFLPYFVGVEDDSNHYRWS